MLKDQNEQEEGNKADQEDDALQWPSILLRCFGSLQLRDALLGMLHNCLHVVINAVQNCSLINNKDRELFENCPQLLDALGNLNDFLVSRLDRLLQIIHNGLLLHGEAKVIVCPAATTFVIHQSKFGLSPFQSTTLLRLNVGKVFALHLPELHTQFLQLLGQTALDIRPDHRLLPTGPPRGGADPLQVPLSCTEPVGDVPGQLFDLPLHLVEVLAEDAAHPTGVHRLQNAHEAGDVRQLLMDGVDVIDPLRGKDRCRTPIDARREGPLLEMEVIASSLGDAYGLLCSHPDEEEWGGWINKHVRWFIIEMNKNALLWHVSRKLLVLAPS